MLRNDGGTFLGKSIFGHFLVIFWSFWSVSLHCQCHSQPLLLAVIFEFLNSKMLVLCSTHSQHIRKHISNNFSHLQQRPANKQKSKKSKKQLPQRNSQRKTSKQRNRPLATHKKTASEVPGARGTQRQHSTHTLHRVFNLFPHTRHAKRGLQTSKNRKNRKNGFQRNSQRKTSKQPERPLFRSKTTYTQVSEACYTQQALFPHLI